MTIEPINNNKKEFIVSDLFLDIYINFNVGDQSEKMRLLSKKELYLLLITCLDNHDSDNKTVINNYKLFREEYLEIMDLQANHTTKSEILLDLIEETGDPYVETDYIVTSNLNKLPKVLTKEQVRDIRINIINNNN
jgi:hypothetical protein